VGTVARGAVKDLLGAFDSDTEEGSPPAISIRIFLVPPGRNGIGSRPPSFRNFADRLFRPVTNPAATLSKLLNGRSYSNDDALSILKRRRSEAIVRHRADMVSLLWGEGFCGMDGWLIERRSP
jgi:hypothetical protein